MDSLLKPTVVSLVLSVGVVHAAEPPSVDQVRTELDRQLSEMVNTPPPEMRLLFVGLDPTQYRLDEVHFTLDGEPLPTPPVEKIGSPGPHVLVTRQVKDGPHTLVTNVVYMDASWNMFSPTSGLLWNLTSTLNFQTQNGLRVDVTATTVLVPEAKDPRLKVKLAHGVNMEMIAKLEDVALPELPPPPPPAKKAEAPRPAPTPAPPARQQKAKLLVRVLSSLKPVAATVSLRGATAQQVSLKKGARAPVQVEVAPGDYVADVLAPGLLAQTRRVRLEGGTAQPLDFALVRAPKKALAKDKNGRVELPKPLRFPEGKPVPLPDSASLSQLVDLLVRNPTWRLRIEGHTHNQEGDEGARKQLSEARARAVMELLVGAGLEPSRLETQGLADTQPKAPNFTARGRELNRRVELLVLER
ncbi:MAG TPA: OmpA family protein [Archangium sp.]|uniref:OmpA family protein n=1 Tax=Archangium sp. TaxID=1872627 RepID=UPI002E37054D|nr:OmpA family protein [Archangium sp.]HEX5753903.1 OmpA family protein [Archangium sp.]